MDEKKNSILIVDDDKHSLQLLTEILEPEYTLFTANSGQEAIDLVKKSVPDLILLDILLPDINGYEVINALRECVETRDFPVIFIAGLDGIDEEEQGLASGAADYIRKPLVGGIVLLRVRNQLRYINQMRSMERLSRIDALTNVANRRSFDEQLDIEWRRSIRSNAPISLLMGDVDLFKRYNDTYGHLQGDEVLRTVAQTLAATVRRPADFVARWGGEEFVLLLPDTDVRGALTVAEMARRHVEHAEIKLPDGRGTKVTVSIGTSTQTPTYGSTPDKLVADADRAMYKAKKAGRNCVRHAT